MGKKKTKAPATPDYAAIAKQQAVDNNALLDKQTAANRVNQVNPWGEVKWNQDASGNWTQTTSLNDQQRSALDGQMALQNQRTQTAQGLMQRASDSMSQPMDTSGFAGWGSAPQAGNVRAGQGPSAQYVEPSQGPQAQYVQADRGPSAERITAGSAPQAQYVQAGDVPQAQYIQANQGPSAQYVQANQGPSAQYVQGGDIQMGIGQTPRYFESAGDAIYRQAASRLDPRFGQQEAEMRAKLTNMGLKPGDRAWDNEMANFDRGRNDAYSSAINAAISGAGQEASRYQGMDLNAGNFANQAQAQQFGQNLNANNQYFNQATTANQNDFNNRFNAQQAYFNQATTANQNDFNNRMNAQNQYYNQARTSNQDDFSNRLNAQNQYYNQARSSNQDDFNNAMASSNQYYNQARTANQDAFANDMASANQYFNQGTTANQNDFNNRMNANSQFFNQGTTANQNAFNNDMNAQNQWFNQQLAQSNYQNNLRDQQFREAQAMRNMPLNEMNAFLTGQSVNAPQFSPFNLAGKGQAADLTGAAQNTYQAGMDKYNADQAYNNSITSGLFGLAGSAIRGVTGGFLGR